jgi:hypothetical protein
MTAARASGAIAKLTAEPVERRARRPVAMIAYALREDGSSVELMVLDLSYEGCGVETPVELKAAEPLKLSVLRRGAISCRVRWCANGKAGLVFDPEAITVERCSTCWSTGSKANPPRDETGRPKPPRLDHRPY